MSFSSAAGSSASLHDVLNMSSPGLAQDGRSAYLSQLRRRQAALLRDHASLSGAERDVFMDQGRIALHSSRAAATVEELYLESPAKSRSATGTFFTPPERTQPHPWALSSHRSSGSDMSSAGSSRLDMYGCIDSMTVSHALRCRRIAATSAVPHMTACHISPLCAPSS
jgi:hypothetical protein